MGLGVRGGVVRAEWEAGGHPPVSGFGAAAALHVDRLALGCGVVELAPNGELTSLNPADAYPASCVLLVPTACKAALHHYIQCHVLQPARSCRRHAVQEQLVPEACVWSWFCQVALGLQVRFHAFHQISAGLSDG